MKPPLEQGHRNDFQTPPESLLPLLPYINKDWAIWEPACGKGNLVNELNRLGYQCIGSDILTDWDFLKDEMPVYDFIITNPPYSIKHKFIARCYALGKPFALLMPLTALETEYRQSLYSRHGLQIILMPKRINFETPSGNGSGSWFATAWFTNRLNLPRDINYYQPQTQGTFSLTGEGK